MIGHILLKLLYFLLLNVKHSDIAMACIITPLITPYLHFQYISIYNINDLYVI